MRVPEPTLEEARQCCFTQPTAFVGRNLISWVIGEVVLVIELDSFLSKRLMKIAMKKQHPLWNLSPERG